MSRKRLSRHRLRTAVKGLLIAVVFWSAALALSVPLGAHWPRGFPGVDIPANALARVTMANGERIGPHPAVFLYETRPWEAWLWFAILVGLITFYWEKSWMQWHFTDGWAWLDRGFFLANVMLVAFLLRSLTAQMYPELGRGVGLWPWAQRWTGGLLLAALAFGFVQMLLIEDADEDPA